MSVVKNFNQQDNDAGESVEVKVLFTLISINFDW